MRSRTTSLLAALGGAVLLGTSANAQFVRNESEIPAEASSSESVDFGDIDLDGDWDALIADGGDDGNDQNRVWINTGNAISAAGPVYVDETSTRYPTFLDDSRDLELVDIEGDGDLDLYVSNTSAISNQGNRWLTNDGTGVFSDQTGLHWNGLGVAGPNGSSIPASLVIAAGSPGGGDTFIDFSCDCDFGDLDNDGDLDLVHSSYGGLFGGNVPTRLFLNDGAGLFTEFNPGGFQMTTSTVVNGQSGLWCDGTQQNDTVNSNGTNCDIASSALDIDVGDIDGDFDLDILHGARQEAPRMFANRLEGSTIAPANGGALGFRDVTGSVFPGGYTSGDGHYEQEMGDLDGDGDLDIYGLNWLAAFGFTDITLRNDGDGTFSNVVSLSGSSADDNEGDFLDYDNDGDLDLFVANFSGQDKLYRNNNNGGTSFSYTEVAFPNDPPGNSVSLDGDCCDIDDDGDYDIVVAMDNFQRNLFYENTTGTPDTTAPYVPNVEDVGAQTADGGSVAIRAHVYDNAPYYITYFNETVVDVAVNGIDLPAETVPAMSSGGQIFRAELPKHFAGDVTYTFRSEDRYGNTGTGSETVTFTAPAGALVDFGTATMGTLGEPQIDALTVPYPGNTLYLAGSNAPAFTTAAIAVGNTALPSPIAIGSLVTLNVLGVPSFLTFPISTTDANGVMLLPIPVPAFAPPGFTAHAQFFALNGITQAASSSQGLSITIQ